MWTKICGVTNPEDAEQAVQAGVSAIGLNFFRDSRRRISAESAAAVRRIVPGDIDLVGVFVNHAAEEVAEHVAQFQLSAVQFHGDESVESIAAFHDLSRKCRIVCAVRAAPDSTAAAVARLHQLADSVPLAAVLIDAWSPRHYGGTGQLADSETTLSLVRELPHLRWIAAGGLTPENIRDVVDALHPWGVDTASGVEDAPGVKNAELMQAFVNNAGTSNDRL